MRCAQPAERAQQRSAVRCGASKGRSEYTKGLLQDGKLPVPFTGNEENRSNDKAGQCWQGTSGTENRLALEDMPTRRCKWNVVLKS